MYFLCLLLGSIMILKSLLPGIIIMHYAFKLSFGSLVGSLGSEWNGIPLAMVGLLAFSRESAEEEFGK